jgi:type VI secretion system secreted protein VgrG
MSDEGLSQATRKAILKTPLGEDELVLREFDGKEELGRLFEFRIDAISRNRDINFDSCIGQACSVTLKTSGPDRYFNGILVEAEWRGPLEDNFAYRLLLRPWFWLLTRTTDCRIFENKNVLDIIKQVFSDRGFNDFEDKTTTSYPKIEYCVQYRETDFDFVSRLMEENGIYYFFEHSADKHMLNMADSKSSLKPIPGLSTLPFIALAGQDRSEEQYVSVWVAGRSFQTGKVELKDYDYLKPNAKLLSDANGTAGYTKSKMEFYDYPGRYKEQSDGDRFAKIKLEAQQALDQRRFASGHAASLFPGGLVTLEKQIKPSENVEYLVLSATHRFSTENYRTGGGGMPDQVYQGSYSFLPSNRPFRSLPTTPKPLVHGPQTAKVVGKSGEEIDVDEYGRILVEFYWDRKKMKSCRVRIAQVWSGKAWGGIFIPRIDQEVVVEYLEGDPDRPLVTGTVYNNDNKVPYSLPDNKTKGGFKTDSTKGHGGYNEFVFEDKKDSEQIGLHAQKDLGIVVLNQETREIGQNFMPPMGSASRSTTLHNGDDELTLEVGNQTIDIAGIRTMQVGMTMSTTAQISMTLMVGMSTVVITPASVSITSPTITLLAEAEIALTASTSITITAPKIDLVGLTTINGMVPVTIPAPAG